MSGTPSAGAPPQPVPLERLLTLYLDPSLTLADIAFTLGLSIAELITLTDAPDFRALVERHAAAHERRAADLCRVGRDLAARTLTRIAETCDKPETARKAAGAVLRISAPRATDSLKESVPRATDSLKESVPRATDSLKESVPNTRCAQPAPTRHPSPALADKQPVAQDQSPRATGGSPASAPRPRATGGSPASARTLCAQPAPTRNPSPATELLRRAGAAD